jgi:hypothetical protein
MKKFVHREALDKCVILIWILNTILSQYFIFVNLRMQERGQCWVGIIKRIYELETFLSLVHL